MNTHPAFQGDEPNFARDVAHRGMILLTRVGSTVTGCAVDDQDDRDEMGICVPPRECVLGLETFDQYEWRTQPTGVRSGPGDVDLTVYALRKWMRLAIQGNPSILVPLFVPIDQVVYANDVGMSLRRSPDFLLSRRAGHRFLGYMRSQRAKLLGERGGATNRPELIERYGFDTKFAYHMVRLGLQGVELLRTGRITLPMHEQHASWLRELRVGRRSMRDAIDVTMNLEVSLQSLLGPESRSPLPERHDNDAVNKFLIDAHADVWGANEMTEENEGDDGE